MHAQQYSTFPNRMLRDIMWLWLGRWLAQQMGDLKYPGGQPVARLYGAHAGLLLSEAELTEEEASAVPLGAVDQGPVVTFNLLRSDGSYVGYR